MDQEDSFDIFIDGRAIKARKGQTIAEVLLSNSIETCRRTRKGQERGVYCGMGVCHECRMIVDKVPNVRTCMTYAQPGTELETQDDARIDLSYAKD
jgi:predicted molibdopterin-dependent oxidoreductase YjgC